MIDWMIQVFRVLKVNSPKTYVLSCSLMDRYFLAKKNIGFTLDKSDLHMIGLVSLLVATKYEEIKPITMQ